MTAPAQSVKDLIVDVESWLRKLKGKQSSEKS